MTDEDAEKNTTNLPEVSRLTLGGGAREAGRAARVLVLVRCASDLA